MHYVARMKDIFAAVIILILPTLCAADAGEGRTLRCGANTITGVGTDTVVLKEGNFPAFSISRQTDGDCENRAGMVCYQDGQLMVNIAADLSSGKVSEGLVWINEDTDDRPENNRLGDQYTCVAE